MVGASGKTPRYELTARERQLYLEGLLSERHARRVRRAQEKGAQGGGKTKRAKKATRKRAAKHTTAAMETRSVGVSMAAAEAKVTPQNDEPARVADEAKETAGSEEATPEPVVEEMLSDMLAAVADAGIAAAERTPPPVGNPRKRRRALLQEESADEDGASGGDGASDVERASAGGSAAVDIPLAPLSHDVC
ncbi:hypothetical protein PHYSODRAFT_264493 [Phytophthora sojae]|uniref:Uncharacterized protein n=1 Tax=Phytophthora sojae (strain P6497) TaxID=1094619 RepID=G4Z348_PHYSP|nr:hypothetical protein PHYSODRAFT_264493 [Phytophthora sojae]EGZ20077.1 hypothetical protein PHYSODRAFT_264493 [Phytophthora sojae]|eukprot:XP_009522794.1 hypothetical protein PHYSODRAFT_264493 [Phytophthora sojae]